MLKLSPLPLFTSLTLLASCSTTGSISMEPEAGVEFLAQCLTGTFDSVEQAEAEPAYFPVRLRSFPIWVERTDGPWLYVEQALMSTLDLPYRQRVYHLSAAGAGFRSVINELPGDPLRFAGKGPEDPLFASTDPSELVERAGCAMDLEVVALDGRPAFVGSTADKSCTSDRSGASYATSLVTLTDDVLESWDRGFDSENEQVWGAVAGPYRFVRVPGTFPIPGH